MGANQFTNKLKETMEIRYKMPFKNALQMLANSGLTRSQVARELGFSDSAIIKHSLRLGVKFEISDSFTSRKDRQDSIVKEEFQKQLKKSQLTPINVLSKKWSDFHF